MSIRDRIVSVLLVCACLGLTTGCKTQSVGADDDLLNPEDVIPGDYALEPWKDPGRRVTTVEFDDVLFRYDSSQLDRPQRQKIEAVNSYLKRNARVKVVLEGHCDERGSREYNILLGERRALAARTYMIELNIDSSRILTRSYGEEKPKDPGHNNQAWRLNRRVEFVLYR